MSFRRRMMMAANKGESLPSGYQKIEYISTTTNMYFKTGFIPTKGCRVEVTIKGNATTTLKAGTIFGYRVGYNNNSFYLRSSVSSGSSTSMTMLCALGTERSVSVNIDANNKNVYGVDNGKFYVNDVTLGTYSNNISPTQELYLLRCNQNGSVQFYAPTGLLYLSQIWDDDGNLVRNYIPVKRISDNRVGLYDLVNDTFTTASY